ncbi:MAG: phosphodiester glycosidase family protein [Clostridia bacterium]|nr:phosphodiester glycosidase family protein [Clostridia bacterium]
MEKQKKKQYRGLRVVASILANLTGILTANYIVFYILDHFNPGLHFVIHSTFFLTEHLHLIIAGLTLITGILYLILFRRGAFRRYRFQKKRLIGILVADVLLAGAFAMTVNTYTFDWLHIREIKQDQIVALATLPPKEAQTPDTNEDTVVMPETPQPTAHAQTQAADDTAPAPTDTPEPTQEPTPTPIPGLLGDRFKEKFSDGAPVVEEPNTSETLPDGTVKTLIYVYRGTKSAVELYHYQKGKLEYQIADVYVREIEKLTTESVTNQGYAKMLYEFARELNARIAINSDYFTTNAINEGLIIRNGKLLQSKVCKNSDLCVVYQDGMVRCFDCKKEKIDNDAIIASYPYHAFYFGPSLLDENGNAKEKFNSTVGALNPRTAFGYYEPGHYAFISILGTRSMKDINGHGLGNGKSPGMTFTEMSALCASMGMKAAYNLDGGQSSGMYWNEKLFGHNNRITGDVLAIID